MKDQCEKETIFDKIYYIIILTLMLVYTLINKTIEQKKPSAVPIK